MQGRRILENLMFYNYNFVMSPLEVEVIVGYLTVTRKSNMDSTPPRGGPYHMPYSQILFVTQEYFIFHFSFLGSDDICQLR